MKNWLLALKILFPEYMTLILLAGGSFVLWRLLAAKFRGRAAWRGVHIVLSVLAVAGILRFSVFGRESDGARRFILFADSEPWDFIPELYRNLFLYYPLGLFLPHAIGGEKTARRRGICVLSAFLLSVAVEAWQYALGTGVAHLSDVLMNTAGAAIGAASCAGVSRAGAKTRLVLCKRQSTGGIGNENVSRENLS